MKKIVLGLLIVIVAVLLPTSAFAAANFSLSPGSRSVTVGSSFSVSINIDTGGQAINAAEGTLSYPSDILEATGVSKSGSIFQYWTQEPYASGGTVRFGGGLPTPGFTGSGGRVITVTFKGLKAGTATVSWNGGRILANDGFGTNIYGSAAGGTYTVTTPAPTFPAPTVSSSTHPDPNGWYNKTEAQIAWNRPSGAIGYSYAFDQNAGTTPDQSSEGTGLSKSYSGLGDGVYYFHIRAQYSGNWSTTAHFAIRVDTTPPNEFTVIVDQPNGPTDAQPIVTFEATDTPSGIDHYEVKVDGGEWVTATSPYQLPRQRPGQHTIIVKAVDKAGNTRESTATVTVVGLPAPTLISVPRYLAILQPMPVVGESASDDTIILYIDGNEVARFVAKDHKIADAGPDKIRWEYTYDKLIVPGRHAVTISSINAQGGESEPSPPQFTTVLPGSIKIGTLIIPTLLVLLIILILLIPLLFWFILFWKRRKKREDEIKKRVAAAEERVHQEMIGLEKEVRKGTPDNAATELRKVEYDIEKTIKSIDDENHPKDKPVEKE